jgi:CheY-like chemotaxis protein
MKTLKDIMLVEDEPHIREVTKLILAKLGGFNVITCDSGTQALGKLEERPLPQLILLDVMMPGMDGPSTLEKIRQIPEALKIPVIFLTAKVQTHEIEQYTSMGVIGILTKPFNPTTISQEITKLWEVRDFASN